MREGRKNYKNIQKLIVISSFTAIVLIVSTYAWFIGMRTVSVNSFDVQIKAADSLMLSLDGRTWESVLEVSKAKLDLLKVETEGVAPYAKSTHTWGGDAGLIPMSSIGELDEDSSRLKLFEKASLTATPGGYRLMASQIKNFKVEAEDPIPAEQNGYIAFDLFVKNFSGTQYLKKLNVLDEEAIYLTIDSEVKVATGGVEQTGIENSVRVAFAQIGRVDASPNKVGISKIHDITCLGDGKQTIDFEETGHDDDYTTGICRTAQIWEPNDTRHISNAIKFYNASCVARSGADVTKKASYSGDCGAVTDGIANPTYSVRKEIKSSDNVDTYDGTGYNGYTNTSVGADVPLSSYLYFTDTTKHLSGNARSSFMTLAPNSITKIRVYVYIEGQDVDNYDFAAIGKKISVNFGFTKERYTEDDILYDGPDVNQGDGPNGEDLTPPVITLIGDKVMTQQKKAANDETPFADPGATAVDNILDGEGDPTPVTVKVLGVVNPKVPGRYTLTYVAIDEAENMASKVRTVIITD